MNTCDIIIPTYNGKEKLLYTIPALLEQNIPKNWNVRLILSDDGSEEDMTNCITEYAWKGAWLEPVVVRSNHKGRSHARNIAIDAATADIMMFLADDIVLRPNALREHLVFHDVHSDAADAALGAVVWDPRISPTPFMNWMMHGGQQNDYDAILGSSVCDAAHYFYGSFVSLKKSFVGDNRFNEEFFEYGWEDLELGARLQRKGLVLHVLHSARALHRHWYSADALIQRQRIIGSAKYLVNTNSIRRIIHGVYGVLGGRTLIRYFFLKWGNTINMPRFFARVTAGEFWYGVHHSARVLKSEK